MSLKTNLFMSGILFMLFTLSCEKDTVVANISTSDVSSITENSAIVGGNVTDEGSTSVTETGIYWSTSSNPEITGTKLSIGSGTGDFSTTLTGLTSSTTYYIKAYAINSVGEALGNEQAFTTTGGSSGESGTFTDARDGREYKWVKIGNQVWMAENLAATKYNDGTAIPLVTDNTAWKNLTTPGYCWYNNDEAGYKNTYGALYNWYTVNTDKLCPTGWHLPTDAEWTTLTDYLGSGSVAGGKLKEIGTTHWDSPNTDATNETGFTALPGGYRGDYGGTFNLAGNHASLWSSTEMGSSLAFNRTLSCYGPYVLAYLCNKSYGYSVRCVRDSE